MYIVLHYRFFSCIKYSVATKHNSVDSTVESTVESTSGVFVSVCMSQWPNAGFSK